MPKKAKGKKGKKGKKNTRPAYMSEELWKLCNNIPDLLQNFMGKPSQTSSLSLDRSKAAFYLWQLALKGKKKRGELVQGGVLTSALTSIETSPDDEEVQVRAPTIGLISSLCVDDSARVAVMGVRNAAVVNQLMSNLSFCTPCTISAAARALAILAKEETEAFLRGATSLDPIAKCLNEDNMLAARYEAASCLATCLKAYLAKNPFFTPQLYQSLQQNKLLVLLSRLCQVSGFSSLHALAKEKAATCLFYLTQSIESRQIFEQMKGVEALASVLVDPYCALIGKAHAAGALYNLLTPDLKLKTLSSLPNSNSSNTIRTSFQGQGSNDHPFESEVDNHSGLLNESSSALGGHLIPSTLREEVSQFEEIVFNKEQKQARKSTVRKLVQAELILPLLHLCCGPEGPPKAVSRAQSAPAPESKSKKGKKGKKKKGKKGKKVKAPPGMNDAHFYGAGCLRHISHYEQFKDEIAERDGERYVIPLLNSKNAKVRWHARAILLNLADTHASELRMAQFGAPKHIVKISQAKTLFDSSRPNTAPVTRRIR